MSNKQKAYNNPPATSMTVPDIYLALVDSRKEAVSAISSGSPMVPRGICISIICCI